MTEPVSHHDNPSRITPQMLVYAYTQGAFPMAEPATDEIYWYSPDPRGVIPLDGFRVSRSLRRVVNSKRFRIRSDRNFTKVMKQCAAPRAAENGETWINDELIVAYSQLHDLGFAHSVEAYLTDTQTGQDVLVGGLYGVAVQGAFFGESMFHREDLGGTDSSKVCLVHLVNHLRCRGYKLLDTQFVTDHLARFGCVEISRDEYMAHLEQALEVDTDWLPFTTMKI